MTSIYLGYAHVGVGKGGDHATPVLRARSESPEGVTLKTERRPSRQVCHRTERVEVRLVKVVFLDD